MNDNIIDFYRYCRWFSVCLYYACSNKCITYFQVLLSRFSSTLLPIPDALFWNTNYVSNFRLHEPAIHTFFSMIFTNCLRVDRIAIWISKRMCSTYNILNARMQQIAQPQILTNLYMPNRSFTLLYARWIDVVSIYSISYYGIAIYVIYIELYTWSNRFY